MQLGEHRVLHPGRWRWLRALGWLVLLFFLTGVAFGIPAQAAVDRLPPGNEALQFVGLLVAAATALGCYALAVWLGEGRGASELALRPALPGFAAGAALGLVMMASLMGILVATGAYDITLVGATPAWTGLGLALQAAVTEELWMRALLLRLLWRAFGPVPAFIVAALVFGGLHLANPGATPLAGATVVMAGLMFCALYAWTGRLWVPIGVHLAWNLAQGYLFGATVSGRHPRRIDPPQHRPPGSAGVADRWHLRPRSLRTRPHPGRHGDRSRTRTGPKDRHLRRPTPARNRTRPGHQPQLNRVSANSRASQTPVRVSRSVPGRTNTCTASPVRKPLMPEKSDTGATIKATDLVFSPVSVIRQVDDRIPTLGQRTRCRSMCTLSGVNRLT